MEAISERSPRAPKEFDKNPVPILDKPPHLFSRTQEPIAEQILALASLQAILKNRLR
jgi:hypothetical protein